MARRIGVFVDGTWNKHRDRRPRAFGPGRDSTPPPVDGLTPEPAP